MTAQAGELRDDSFIIAGLLVKATRDYGHGLATGRHGMMVTSHQLVALSATLKIVVGQAKKRQRVFKTAWFARAARKAHVTDDELCSAIPQVMLGQAEDLGGGVVKKRIRKNQYRAIILAKAGHHWVYEYLFAKQDRANIEDDELASFRGLAKAYAGLTAQQIDQLIRDRDWMEICNGDQA